MMKEEVEEENVRVGEEKMEGEMLEGRKKE